MPHVVINCYNASIASSSLDRIAREIATLLEEELACSPGAVSVDLQLVEPSDWKKTVYLPFIAPRLAHLLRKPGYSY